jgi:hypothetical protein
VVVVVGVVVVGGIVDGDVAIVVVVVGIVDGTVVVELCTCSH